MPTSFNDNLCTEAEEELNEPVMEPPSIPCSGSGNTTKESVTPRGKKRNLRSLEEELYENMNNCLGAIGKKTVNEAFGAYIASEIDNLPCPKRQRAIRAKIVRVLLECLQE
ncbi:hypothetical protein TNIN_500151 [Trichonephila inaurata madagascariensis]|uniref:Uncharacterized protein n=1 Tax=Trichonephila inaurata madagascariensis TaxID=2747483 RepID=A0A8X7CBH8_9ARAC|nr:hypothetical protein TNIN_500151 [Trichonephila inaurata madagascariensis]